MDQQQGLPMVPTILNIQGPGRNMEWHGNEVPARVHVAMTYLRDLTFKTMTRGMVNDMGMTELPGQQLLPVEEKGKAAATEMLVAYFEGKLKPTQWEQNAAKQEEDPVKYDQIDCPACRNQVARNKENCGFCQGNGRVGLPRSKGG